MDFLEKDLEQIIYEATDEQLQSMYLKGRRFKQLRIGNFGISDLVFVDRDYSFYFNDHTNQEIIDEYGLKITVCELKKDKIGISSFLQAIRYCKGIRSYLNKRGFNNFYFEILLMGRILDTSGNFPFITDLFNNEHYKYQFNNSVRLVSFYTYEYTFDGIKFIKQEGYNLTEKGF